VSTLIHERVALAREGRNPTVITRVPSGWVVLGDDQFLRGYALLLPDPVVSDLNALPPAERAAFLRDMALVGDALLEVTDAYRINYEILGNSDPALHAHIFPRYSSEPEERRRRPVWFYDRRELPKFDLERDRALMEALAEAIRRRLPEAGMAPYR
jgi:diadenosine tetraphosphate (Ap4A) HIT family hydrolase